MKFLILAALTTASTVFLNVSSPVLSNEGEKPPAGSKDASCRYSDNTPGFCKVRIVSETPGKLQVWIPEGRQSAMASTYTGKCLKKGCILTGEDYGYTGGPAKYEVLEFTKSVIKFKERSLNKAIHEIRILGR